MLGVSSRGPERRVRGDWGTFCFMDTYMHTDSFPGYLLTAEEGRLTLSLENFRGMLIKWLKSVDSMDVAHVVVSSQKTHAPLPPVIRKPQCTHLPAQYSFPRWWPV